MKMLLSVEFPLEPFNSLVRSGKVGEIIGRILESIKPETAYFSERDGKRGGIFWLMSKHHQMCPSLQNRSFSTSRTLVISAF